MEAFVYSWSDHKTAKIYVGVHKGSQTDGYVCSSKPMMVEYRKRPTDFTRQIIAEGTLNDCAVLEVAIIKQLLKDKESCYNRAAGKMIINDVHPMLGKKHTPDSLKKISDSGKGRKLHGWHREKLHEGNRGNKYTLGYRHTKDTLKIISETSKRPKSEETKRKIALAHTGKKTTQATIFRLQRAHVTQACVINGTYYFSIMEAHRQTGIGFSTIISWCKNPERKRTSNYAHITECRYADA